MSPAGSSIGNCWTSARFAGSLNHRNHLYRNAVLRAEKRIDSLHFPLKNGQLVIGTHAGSGRRCSHTAASPESVQKHFAAVLEFETDCADVNHAVTKTASDFEQTEREFREIRARSRSRSLQDHRRPARIFDDLQKLFASLNSSLGNATSAVVGGAPIVLATRLGVTRILAGVDVPRVVAP